MNTEARMLNRIDQIIEKSSQVLETKANGYSTAVISQDKMAGLQVSGLSFIGSLFDKEHSYYTSFAQVTAGYFYSDAQSAHEILLSIKEEIEGGWLQSVKSLVSSEIFTDFIGMAEHLLEASYKDPAAVMIGSVLEEQLRHIATSNGVDVFVEVKEKKIPKKADRLNADLTKASCYTPIVQKSVTSWLAIRNSAAHGKYSEYSHAQVSLMLAGVTDFISKTLQ